MRRQYRAPIEVTLDQRLFINRRSTSKEESNTMAYHYYHIRFELSEETFKVRRNLLLLNTFTSLLLLGRLENPTELNAFGVSPLLQVQVVIDGLFLFVSVQMCYFLCRVFNEFNRHWSEKSDEKIQREQEVKSLQQNVWIAPKAMWQACLFKLGMFEVTIPILFSLCVLVAISLSFLGK